MALHELLAEEFTSFQLGRCAGRTNYNDMAGSFIRLKKIIDAIHQWIFRSYHYHVYLLFDACLPDCRKIIDSYRQVGAQCRRSRVTGRYPELAAVRTGGYFPGQRMFATTGTED
jgi:hypothetical protein